VQADPCKKGQERLENCARRPNRGASNLRGFDGFDRISGILVSQKWHKKAGKPPR